jgi:hypothetical protein
MRAGGNLVQVTPGTEQTIAETIETMLMHGKVQREELIVCTTFPRKLDPYLASAPPGLPASVYFTPDPYNEKLKEIPPLSVTDASHPMIVEDFDEVLQYSLDAKYYHLFSQCRFFLELFYNLSLFFSVVSVETTLSHYHDPEQGRPPLARNELEHGISYRIIV